MFQIEKSKVYIIGVPIGNYNDITLRALKIIKDVSLILCEDTRETKKLLEEFSIKKNLISYIGSHNFALRKALESLKKGESIGIVCDRGMPCISDPGADLINFFRELNFDVKIIPGISSITTGFALTGLKGGFNFIGFLSRKERVIREKIKKCLEEDHNIMFFESSNRIKKTLTILSSFLDRKIYILRELTKTYEDLLIGTPNELLKKDLKGELIIVISR